jgi:hypothetical protein
LDAACNVWGEWALTGRKARETGAAAIFQILAHTFRPDSLA